LLSLVASDGGARSETASPTCDATNQRADRPTNHTRNTRTHQWAADIAGCFESSFSFQLPFTAQVLALVVQRVPPLLRGSRA
jgi:hypothetical protein